MSFLVFSLSSKKRTKTSRICSFLFWKKCRLVKIISNLSDLQKVSNESRNTQMTPVRTKTGQNQTLCIECGIEWCKFSICQQMEEYSQESLFIFYLAIYTSVLTAHTMFVFAKFNTKIISFLVKINYTNYCRFEIKISSTD